MKKFYILVMMLLVSISAIAQDGRSIYNKYSDSKGVEAVYISPAMFRLIGKIPDIQMNNESVNLGPVIQSLTGLYILSTSQESIFDNLTEDVDRFVKKGHYELLMETKESGEVTRMYTVGTEKIVNGLVMLTRDHGEATFICIDGAIPREQLESLIAEAASK